MTAINGMVRHTPEPGPCELCGNMIAYSKTLDPELAIQLLKDCISGHRCYSEWSDADYPRDPRRAIGFRGSHHRGD